MLDYPDYVTQEINNMRHYVIDECKKYPSITTMLGATVSDDKIKILSNWQKSMGIDAANEYTNLACDRGTAVHKLIELFLSNETIDESLYDSNHIKVFKSLKIPLRKINNLYGLEVALYSDNLKIAGRTDCIGYYEDVLSVIDFKTTSRSKNDSEIYDYWLQITFYAICHNELYGTDINCGVVLMGNEKGVPATWVKKDLTPYIEPLIERVFQFYKKYEILQNGKQ